MKHDPLAMIAAGLYGLALILASPANAVADGGGSSVPAFDKVRRSLAVVYRLEEKSLFTGTAFCIQSDGRHSFFLTNSHVVGKASTVALRPESDHKLITAHVIRLSVPPLDAAILETDTSNVTALALSGASPREGQSVAIIGYPSVEFNWSFAPSPSVHVGTVNSLPVHGYYIEHDAVTDHGNSGGPLFDPTSGTVFGIVTFIAVSRTSRAVQNNFAIAAQETFSFVHNAGVNPQVLTASAAPITTAKAVSQSTDASIPLARPSLSADNKPASDFARPTKYRDKCLAAIRSSYDVGMATDCLAAAEEVVADPAYPSVLYISEEATYREAAGLGQASSNKPAAAQQLRLSIDLLYNLQGNEWTAERAARLNRLKRELSAL